MKEKNVRRKRHPLRKLIIAILLLLIFFAIGWYVLLNHFYEKMNYSEVISVTDEAAREDGVINILLIGNDSRENGEDGRSDAMILLSVSSKTKSIQMISLLRDMYVEIPGHDANRLNAAYAYGGPELLMETIEYNFDIKVNRYMLVNFEAFAGLVDAVGGIELEITSGEAEYINAYLVEYNILTEREEGTDYLNPAGGMVHLNGPQALAFVRNRYIGTDFGRTERQRKVLSGVLKKLPVALVSESGELVNGLLPNLTTNLTKEECYVLGLNAPAYLGYELVQGRVPVEGSYRDALIRGMAVLEVDYAANRAYLRSSIYGENRE